MLDKEIDSEKGFNGGGSVNERQSPGPAAAYDGQIDEGIAKNEDLHRGLKARQISMVRAVRSSLRESLADLLLLLLLLADCHRRLYWHGSRHRFWVRSDSRWAGRPAPRLRRASDPASRRGPCARRRLTLSFSLQIMGFCAFATMMSLGEMATYLPSKKVRLSAQQLRGGREADRPPPPAGLRRLRLALRGPGSRRRRRLVLSRKVPRRHAEQRRCVLQPPLVCLAPLSPSSADLALALQSFLASAQLLARSWSRTGRRSSPPPHGSPSSSSSSSSSTSSASSSSARSRCVLSHSMSSSSM